MAASSHATRAATKRPADAAAIKIDRQLLDGVRLRACLAALLEAVLDEGACRDRVHDALIRIEGSLKCESTHHRYRTGQTRHRRSW